MDENAAISQALQNRLGGNYSVETRVNYWQYNMDQKPDAGFVFVMRNPLIESDMETAKKEILEKISKIDVLKPYVVTETNTNHMERLAKDLEEFRKIDLAVNGEVTTIHSKAPEWFRELPKRSGWNIKHALDVKKEDTGIVTVSISIPKDASPEDIAKNIENRKAAILTTLADRVEKYTPTAKTQVEKDALKAKIKALEFSVLPQGDGDSKSIKIMLMSHDQLAATKLPGGITADKVKDLNATNPLLALQMGEDDSDPGKPQPHLQKALARAILYSGDKHEEILPYVMGKEDMRRMIGKSLSVLKTKISDKPDVIKKIDEFLADPVFKDLRQWDKEVEKQEFRPEAPTFNKMVGDLTDPSKPYEPGVMTVTVKLPADKFPEIRKQLAALDAPATGSPESVSQAVDARMLPLVQAMVTTIQNQQQIANHLLEQEAKATPAGVLEKAATALVTVANKLGSWVDRMEARNQTPVAAANTNGPAASDEALANTILAAAGIVTTPSGSVAGSIAASGPTSLLSRAEKPAESASFVLKP